MRTGIAVDGGGILGIGSIRLLKELNYCGEDFLAGTSVGSIIVALRATGMTWERVYNIFRVEGAGIFEKPSIWWRMNPLNPRYDNKNLKNILKKYFGDTRMSDLVIPVYIAVSDFKTGKPKVFDRTDTEFVRDVVLMSCSAPTYFPPVGKQYADGGLWANNPCLVGVAGYASQHVVDLDQIRVLSLGTGGDYYHGSEITGSLNQLQWANRIIEFELNCTEDYAGFVARQLMGDRFLRIEPHVSKRYSMDDVSCMNEYEAIWCNHWNTNKVSITDWINK